MNDIEIQVLLSREDKEDQSGLKRIIGLGRGYGIE